MKFNRDSNAYTITYASVMVILVAVALAFTSQSLKESQKANVEVDKMTQILRAVNVSATADDAKEKYNEIIKAAYLVNADGSKAEGDAFTADIAKASKADGAPMPVFEATVDGQTKYICALYGAGLWGPIWGYIALNEDGNTVFGTDLGHQGETPGLGAEIATPMFMEQFKDKEIFKGGDFKSIAIVKPGKSAAGQDYVDGISGGTITSQGVDVMIKASLERYVKFLSTKK